MPVTPRRSLRILSRVMSVILAVILTPAWLPIVVLVIIISLVMMLYFFVIKRCAHAALRRRMRQSGRLIGESILQDNGAAAPGTLMIDITDRGDCVTRLWWTPDEVLALGPQPIYVERPPERTRYATLEFLTWCRRVYINGPDAAACFVDLEPRRADEYRRRPELVGMREAIFLCESETQWRNHPVLCPHCTYDMTGVRSEICPECGNDITVRPDPHR